MVDAPPYLIGAFLAVNAIPDAYFLLDAIECMFSKARFIQGQHDVFSTLLNCSGENRIMHTDVNLVRIASNFEQGVVQGLLAAAAQPGCGAVLCGAIPTCAIAGTDYDRIVRDTAPRLGKPAFVLPARSLSQDWLGGYAAVLESLAGGLDLSGAKPLPENVAVVGYFMDRTEGEHRANVAELKRMLRALGLNPVSVWLSNEPVERLREVRHASAIISLPHGRQAARVLAQRLGIKLVETGLPFGLDAAVRWVEHVAGELGRCEQAAAFIARELDATAPRLEWVIPQAFLGRRFVFIGDPLYAESLAGFIEEVGGQMTSMQLIGAPEHLDAQTRERLATRRGVAFGAGPLSSAEDLKTLLAEDQADLLITCSGILDILPPDQPWIEWGYPSYYTHFFYDEPFLGFAGCPAFLSRMSNAMSRRFAVGRYPGRACPAGLASGLEAPKPKRRTCAAKAPKEAGS